MDLHDRSVRGRVTGTRPEKDSFFPPETVFAGESIEEELKEGGIGFLGCEVAIEQ